MFARRKLFWTDAFWEVLEGRQNQSCDRVPDSWDCKPEPTQARRLGVCTVDRKEPLVTKSERPGTLVGSDKRRHIRRKSVWNVRKRQSQSYALCCIWQEASVVPGKEGWCVHVRVLMMVVLILHASFMSRRIEDDRASLRRLLARGFAVSTPS